MRKITLSLKNMQRLVFLLLFYSFMGLMPCFSQSTNLNATWYFTDFVGNSGTNVVKIDPLFSYTINGTNVITGDSHIYTNTISLTVSNMLPGLYRVTFMGLTKNTIITNVFPYGTSGNVIASATNYIGVGGSYVQGGVFTVPSLQYSGFVGGSNVPGANIDLELTSSGTNSIEAIAAGIIQSSNGTTLAGMTNVVNPAILAATNTVWSAANNRFYLNSNPSNYVTASVTNGMATTNFVTGFGYANQAITNGLATTNFVNVGILSAINNELLLSSNAFYAKSNPSNFAGITDLNAASNVLQSAINFTTNGTSPVAVTNIANSAASAVLIVATNYANTNSYAQVLINGTACTNFTMTASNLVYINATNSAGNNSANLVGSATNIFVGTMNAAILTATNSTINTVNAKILAATNNSLVLVTNIIQGATNNLVGTVTNMVQIAVLNTLNAGSNSFYNIGNPSLFQTTNQVGEIVQAATNSLLLTVNMVIQKGTNGLLVTVTNIANTSSAASAAGALAVATNSFDALGSATAATNAFGSIVPFNATNLNNRISVKSLTIGGTTMIYITNIVNNTNTILAGGALAGSLFHSPYTNAFNMVYVSTVGAYSLQTNSDGSYSDGGSLKNSHGFVSTNWILGGTLLTNTAYTYYQLITNYPIVINTAIVTNGTFYDAYGAVPLSTNILTKTAYDLGTNFFNRNMKFIDITNGNDSTGDGSMNHSWASLTNNNIYSIPNGWTVCVAPGGRTNMTTSSPYCTEILSLNYNLAYGANVYFHSDGRVGEIAAFTNCVITGQGNVGWDSFGDDPNLHKSAKIFCHDFKTIGYAEQNTNCFIDIYCDQCEISLDGIIDVAYGGAEAGVSENSSLIVHCAGTANFGALGLNEEVINLKVYAETIIATDPTGIPEISSNCVFSATTAYLTNLNFSADLSLGFTWAVDNTYCNGIDPHFPTNMTFIGSPQFDHVITAPQSRGMYLDPNGWHNITINLVGVIPTNNLPMSQLGGAGGGSASNLTPWTSDINGGGYSLTNAGTVSAATLKQGATNLSVIISNAVVSLAQSNSLTLTQAQQLMATNPVPVLNATMASGGWPTNWPLTSITNGGILPQIANGSALSWDSVIAATSNKPIYFLFGFHDFTNVGVGQLYIGYSFDGVRFSFLNGGKSVWSGMTGTNGGYLYNEAGFYNTNNGLMYVVYSGNTGQQTNLFIGSSPDLINWTYRCTITNLTPNLNNTYSTTWFKDHDGTIYITATSSTNGTGSSATGAPLLFKALDNSWTNWSSPIWLTATNHQSFGIPGIESNSWTDMSIVYDGTNYWAIMGEGSGYAEIYRSLNLTNNWIQVEQPIVSGEGFNYCPSPDSNMFVYYDDRPGVGDIGYSRYIKSAGFLVDTQHVYFSSLVVDTNQALVQGTVETLRHSQVFVIPNTPAAFIPGLLTGRYQDPQWFSPSIQPGTLIGNSPQQSLLIDTANIPFTSLITNGMATAPRAGQVATWNEAGQLVNSNALAGAGGQPTSAILTNLSGLTSTNQIVFTNSMVTTNIFQVTNTALTLLSISNAIILTNIQPQGIAFHTSTAATTNTAAIWVLLSTNLTAGQQIWVLGVTNKP